MNFGWNDWHSWHEFWVNFGCTVDTVDTVDTNFGVNCVNCVNCAPSSKRSPFAVAMHYQQRQRQQQQQQQQQEQREGIKTITTTNTHTQTAITILCPGASPALRSPSIPTQLQGSMVAMEIYGVLDTLNYQTTKIRVNVFQPLLRKYFPRKVLPPSWVCQRELLLHESLECSLLHGFLVENTSPRGEQQ